MKIRFILNPVSGRAIGLEKLTAVVRKVFSSDRGIFEVRVAKDDLHARALTEEALSLGYNYVFACGGDGTVHHVASALVGTGTVLGVVPAGSGNALAGALNIPQDAEQAVAVVKKGRIINVDVGSVAQRFFFTTASLAIEVQICKTYNSMKFNPRGILPYIPIALFEYLRYRPQRITVKTQEETFTLSPLVFTVANTGVFGGEFVISPYSEPYDGVFEVCIVDGVSFTGGLAAGLKLLKGNIHRAKGYRTLEIRQMTVERPSEGLIQLDGEPIMAPARLAFRVLAGALRVWAY